MRKRAFAGVLIALLTMNCGSIVHQTTQEVRLNSDPPGAGVTVACGEVTNDPRLVTPATVMLHRKASYCSVRLTKEGYAEKELQFGRQMSGWYLGNILIGGVIGLVVDAVNGAMWNHTTPMNATKVQGEVQVKLEPVSTNATGSN